MNTEYRSEIKLFISQFALHKHKQRFWFTTGACVVGVWIPLTYVLVVGVCESIADERSVLSVDYSNEVTGALWKLIWYRWKCLQLMKLSHTYNAWSFKTSSQWGWSSFSKGLPPAFDNLRETLLLSFIFIVAVCIHIPNQQVDYK